MQSKNWCFTSFDDVPPDYNPEVASYLIYGIEKTKEGKQHYQGFIQFHDKKRFNCASKLIGKGVHIEAMRGSPRTASDYCKKDGNYKEFGKMTYQGMRSELIEIGECVIQGAKIREIAEDFPTSFIRYHRGIRELKGAITPQRDLKMDPEVIYIWGPAGGGKTRMAREIAPDAYWKECDSKWWNGYDGETTIIIDDFDYDLLPETTWLRWFQRYPCKVETKGGVVELLGERFILTSNQMPKEKPAFLRRITKTIYVPMCRSEGGNTHPLNP